MVPRNTNTIIIKSGFPAGIIANSLAGLVDSIQVCPGGGGGGRIIRVLFLDPLTKRPMRRPGAFPLVTSVVMWLYRIPSLS